MTDPQKIHFKTRLQEYCISLISERVNNALHAMENAQDAANEESKSSAGDKYETSRAMNHLEKDMHARQLAANKDELASLRSIDCHKLNPTATAGSIVQCKSMSFFIAAGLGKIIFEEQLFYIVSPQAPVAISMLNKKKADGLSFNKEDMFILDIY